VAGPQPVRHLVEGDSSYLPSVRILTGFRDVLNHNPMLHCRWQYMFRRPQTHSQVVALTDVYVGRGKWRVRLRLPALNDAKLLLAALVWPPSCFVSDATAKTGAFAHPAGFMMHRGSIELQTSH
jgi:hypothetical protein